MVPAHDRRNITDVRYALPEAHVDLAIHRCRRPLTHFDARPSSEARHDAGEPLVELKILVDGQRQKNRTSPMSLTNAEFADVVRVETTSADYSCRGFASFQEKVGPRSELEY
jgi:hypothetical protein